ELLPRRQRGEGGVHMPLGLAVKTAFTAKALPLAKDRQGHHRTPAEGSLGARVWFRGQRELAKVIDHNVKRRQEGVHIDHRSAPYLGEDRAILPVRAPSM